MKIESESVNQNIMHEESKEQDQQTYWLGKLQNSILGLYSACVPSSTPTQHLSPQSSP